MAEHALRLAHLTTVDMSLAILLRAELEVRVAEGAQVYGISAPGPFVGEVEALGVTHVAVPSLRRSWQPLADLRAAWELFNVLRRLDLDVLHTHTPKAGVLGRVIGRLAGVPVVVNTCHGLWATREDRWLKRTLVMAAEVVASWCSDAELYQNDDDRRRLRRWVPARKAETVGNGIDLRRFTRDPQAGRRVRDEWGIGADEVVVGGVGRRVAEKGLAEFTAAAGALADSARFVWVGPADPDKASAERDPTGAVQFVDFRTDMPAVYSAFDIFCLPSHREGLSRAGMEAGACGCAVVLSDIRGCRELGVDGTHLRLAPPGDTRALTDVLGELVVSPQARTDLAEAMQAHAHAEFDQARVALRSADAYRHARRKLRG